MAAAEAFSFFCGIFNSYLTAWQVSDTKKRTSVKGIADSLEKMHSDFPSLFEGAAADFTMWRQEA